MAEDQQTISRFLQERKHLSSKKGDLNSSQVFSRDQALFQEINPQRYSIS